MYKVNWRLALLRAIIWSLIGVIYALLFTALLVLMRELGLGDWAYIPGVALAAGASAVLYGAHELALLSTGLGVAVGLVLLILVPGAGLTEVLIAALLVATLLGLTFAFPRRCTRHVLSKLLAGLLLGGACGGFLVIAESMQLLPAATAGRIMILIVISGLLYVGSIRRWIALGQRLGLDALPCDLIESLVMAILAAIAAGSIWVLFVPILGDQTAAWSLASLAIHQQIPQALLGGLLGGFLTGLLLELLHLPWVDDL